MKNYETILVLNNEFEAERLEEVLKDENIPYGIITRNDSVLGGIVEIETGWGYLKAPPGFREKIMQIYETVRNDRQFT